MAGALTISTLNNSSGVLATQNGMTGIAKAWVNFVGSTAVINSSFNVSSITRNAAGDYTINFTTTMPNANYSTAGMAQISSFAGTGYYGFSVSISSTAPTASAVRVLTSSANAGVYDASIVNVAVFSS